MKNLDKGHSLDFVYRQLFLNLFFIDFREGKGKRNINLLLHFFMHLLVDSCMYPDQESNLQPWHIGMML